MHEFSTIFSFFGGAAAATSVLAFFAKFFVDKALERQKDALNRELERLKAELSKEAERYKLRLKKQELIFNMELDAASEFMKLRRQITPRYSHPDMDWNEVCENVADRFDKIEGELNGFFVRHGAVMTTSARRLLTDCIEIASNTKFWRHEYDGSAQGYHYANNKADELLQDLEKIEQQLVAAIRDETAHETPPGTT